MPAAHCTEGKAPPKIGRGSKICLILRLRMGASAGTLVQTGILESFSQAFFVKSNRSPEYLAVRRNQVVRRIGHHAVLIRNIVDPAAGLLIGHSDPECESVLLGILVD